MKWIIDDGLINQTFILEPQSWTQVRFLFLYVRQFFSFYPSNNIGSKKNAKLRLFEIKNTQKKKITLINIKKYPLLWTDCVNNVMDTSSVSDGVAVQQNPRQLEHLFIPSHVYLLFSQRTINWTAVVINYQYVFCWIVCLFGYWFHILKAFVWASIFSQCRYMHYLLMTSTLMVMDIPIKSHSTHKHFISRPNIQTVYCL